MNTKGNTTAKRGSMEDLAGLWKNRGAGFSGQVKEPITLNPGDRIQLFENPDATEENRKPLYRLKVSRATEGTGNGW